MTGLASRHGWNATAFQTLAPGFSYFHAEDEDACVAYVDTGSAWVAAGAPLAAEDALQRVASAFVEEAHRAGKRACFFGTEPRFIERTPDLRAIAIGEQPQWDPREWPRVLRANKSLREQHRRARAKGVTVRRLPPSEAAEGPTHDAVLRVARRWLAGRSMAPMGFLVNCEPFSSLAHRVCFVAEREGQVVGFAGVLPMPARDGWFVEHLLRDPRAPNGTAELLVHEVMTWAAERGSPHVTLGLAPLAGEVSRPLRMTRRWARALYDFDGLRRYKEKLRPESWTRIFLSFPADQSVVTTVKDALVAFAHGGFFAFGLASLMRGPTVVLRALTALLVPWTMLLAIAPARLWFAQPAIKWSWVAFDVILALALFRVVRKPSVPWVSALAAVITMDASLTLLQAFVWNFPRAGTWQQIVMIVLGCAAPALAAMVLWGARRRLVTQEEA